MVTMIRASGLARVMTCAGSLFFKDLPQQESGFPAEEGTAAGQWLQYLLENNLEKPQATHATNGIPFDNDMDFYTRPIAQRMLLETSERIQCEHELNWPTRSGILIGAHPDAEFVDKEGNLHIEDLKYGWGIVDVFENWQLLAYAIGAVVRRQKAFPKIILRIHQPRPHHEDGESRTWEISYEQLLDYKERIEKKCDEIAMGDRELVTSSKCRYCPAAGAACTAFNRTFYRGIETVMGEFYQDDITELELAHQLDLVHRANDVLKIKLDSLQALANDRIKHGKVIPGWITEASYGDRKWKAGISPETIKIITGVEIIKQEMLSPAQAEKAGVSKELVKDLVDRFYKGQKMVRKDAKIVGDKIFGATAPVFNKEGLA